MNIQIGWTGIGVIVAVLAHAYFTVWSAASFKATISSKIDSLVQALQRMDKELEKRDAIITAVWKKIDMINDRLIKVENENGHSS